jgi:mannose-6-phosphate isomerase-like protein (cupin superfamily)
MDNIFKVWGTRQRILINSLVEIDLLNIKKDGFCSEHHHINKINKFVVVSGAFEIKTPFGTKILYEGEDFTIEPPMIHRFKALTDSIVIEMAYVKEGIIDPNDIIRRKQGGRTINGTDFTLDEIEKQGLK